MEDKEEVTEKVRRTDRIKEKERRTRKVCTSYSILSVLPHRTRPFLSPSLIVTPTESGWGSRPWFPLHVTRFNGYKEGEIPFRVLERHGVKTGDILISFYYGRV